MDKECAESRVQSEVTLGAQIAGCVERRVRAGESRPGRSFYGGSAARLWTKLHRQSSGSVAMYRIAAVQVGLGYRGVPPKAPCCASSAYEGTVRCSTVVPSTLSYARAYAGGRGFHLATFGRVMC